MNLVALPEYQHTFCIPCIWKWLTPFDYEEEDDDYEQETDGDEDHNVEEHTEEVDDRAVNGEDEEGDNNVEESRQIAHDGEDVSQPSSWTSIVQKEDPETLPDDEEFRSRLLGGEVYPITESMVQQILHQSSSNDAGPTNSGGDRSDELAIHSEAYQGGEGNSQQSHTIDIYEPLGETWDAERALAIGGPIHPDAYESVGEVGGNNSCPICRHILFPKVVMGDCLVDLRTRIYVWDQAYGSHGIQQSEDERSSRAEYVAFIKTWDRIYPTAPETNPPDFVEKCQTLLQEAAVSLMAIPLLQGYRHNRIHWSEQQVHSLRNFGLQVHQRADSAPIFTHILNFPKEGKHERTQLLAGFSVDLDFDDSKDRTMKFHVVLDTGDTARPVRVKSQYSTWISS